jgi:DNA-binding CsgD family transcriptional regulator
MQTRTQNNSGPRFTAEETILLLSLASGNTIKQTADQLRLPRESLYRLLADLRNKTGVGDDAALSGWVMRNKKVLVRPGGDR